MKLQSPGRRVCIYVGDHDQWHGKSLYASIVQEARKHGLAGATVARGIMGYGAHNAIHEPQLFRLAGDLPVVIELVDSEEAIQAFFPILDDMVGEGMITVSAVDVITYSKE
jgi:PII-like signaling protein